MIDAVGFLEVNWQLVGEENKFINSTLLKNLNAQNLKPKHFFPGELSQPY